jgi:hypothetical protein
MDWIPVWRLSQITGLSVDAINKRVQRDRLPITRKKTGKGCLYLKSDAIEFATLLEKERPKPHGN